MNVKPSIVSFAIILMALYLTEYVSARYIHISADVIYKTGFVSMDKLATDQWASTGVKVCNSEVTIVTEATINNRWFNQKYSRLGVSTPAQLATRQLYDNREHLAKPIAEGVANALSFPNYQLLALFGRIGDNPVPFAMPSPNPTMIYDCGTLLLKVNIPKTDDRGNQLQGFEGLSGYLVVKVTP